MGDTITAMKKTTLLPVLSVIFCLTSFVQSGSAFSSEDRTPPSSPTQLKGWVYDPDFIYLSWKAATDDQGISAYRIYRNGELAATTDHLYFLDMEYDRDVVNKFDVTAVDLSGNESETPATLMDPRYPAL